MSHTGGRTKGLSLGPSNQDSVWLPGCGVSLSRGVFNYLHNDGELQWERSKKRPFQKSSAPSAAAGILRFTSLVWLKKVKLFHLQLSPQTQKIFQFIVFWNKELINTFGWETRGTCKPEGSMNVGAIEHHFSSPHPGLMSEIRAPAAQLPATLFSCPAWQTSLQGAARDQS